MNGPERVDRIPASLGRTSPFLQTEIVGQSVSEVLLELYVRSDGMEHTDAVRVGLKGPHLEAWLGTGAVAQLSLIVAEGPKAIGLQFSSNTRELWLLNWVDDLLVGTSRDDFRPTSAAQLTLASAACRR
jgi:hypothetical protein